MNLDHVFRRRTRLSASDVLRAWVDPALMQQWFWPQFADATYDLVQTGRGDTYRIESQSANVSVSGACLDWGEYGFDLTWHVDGSGAGFEHNGYDTLSVRVSDLPEGGCDLVLTYTVNSDLAEAVTRLWDPTLDRLAAIEPVRAEPVA